MTSTLRHPLAILVVGAPLLLAASGQEPEEPSKPASTRELFLANCATCHGELGDGEGVTDLDRKARSFKDGGFSFGNTPATVQRTITTGIPGTPMPAFGEALTPEQIADLALYVIELGPGLPPPPKNTELVVKDRPLVVRGMLPPIVEHASIHPRGLLIGMPDGFTFEYRTDDVRLLGVRQGLFVDRTDWEGRGGTALRPLGQVVALVDGGDPAPTFSLLTEEGRAPLRAKLNLTSTQYLEYPETWHARIGYVLEPASGAFDIHVVETVTGAQRSIGAGYARQWLLAHEGAEVRLILNSVEASGSTQVPSGDPRVEIRSRDLPGGAREYMALRRTIAVKRNWPTVQERPLDIVMDPEDLTILDMTVVQVPGPSLADLGEDEIVNVLTGEKR